MVAMVPEAHLGKKGSPLGKKKPGEVTPGRIPQNDMYQVGLDWLDFSIGGLSGSSEAEEVLFQYGLLTGEVIDFSPTRATFNGTEWAGSGHGDRGTLIWYEPPSEDDGGLQLDSLGLYKGYEDLLPARHVVIEQDALDYAYRNLPDELELINVLGGRSVTGDHGWRLRTKPKFKLDGKIKFACNATVLSQIDHKEIFDWLVSFSVVSFSRIDIALDDMNKLVSIPEIRATVEAGDYFDASYRCFVQSGKRGEAWGETIYLGAPSSDKRLRIYDKTVESKGKIDCNRWELELRREKANVVGHELLGKMQHCVQECTDYMVQLVCGCVDFRCRGENSEKNRARCRVVNWWSDMLERLKVGCVRVRVPIVAQTVQRSIDWVKRSVAPTLATIKKVLGGDFPSYIEGILDEGAERMDKLKQVLALITDKEKLCY